MKYHVLLFTFLYIIVGAQDAKFNTNKHGSLFYSGIKGNALFESFETLPFPPTGWKLISSGNLRTWDTASLDPFEGNFYAHCLYDETLSDTQREYLVTPVLDLTQFSSAILRFYFQFSKYWGIYPKNNYDLYVLVSTDSGKTFTDTLWNETMTDTSTWHSYDWVKVVISLSDYLSQNKFALAFLYYGYDGAEAALDAIQIETVGGTMTWSVLPLVFPNPVQNNFTVFNLPIPSVLTMIDFSGKMVFEKIVTNGEKIDVSHLTDGIYILQITSAQGLNQQILIKQ